MCVYTTTCIYNMDEQSDIWIPSAVLFWLLFYSGYEEERKYIESGFETHDTPY